MVKDAEKVVAPDCDSGVAGSIPVLHPTGIGLIWYGTRFGSEGL